MSLICVQNNTSFQIANHLCFSSLAIWLSVFRYDWLIILGKPYYQIEIVLRLAEQKFSLDWCRRLLLHEQPLNGGGGVLFVCHRSVEFSFSFCPSVSVSLAFVEFWEHIGLHELMAPVGDSWQDIGWEQEEEEEKKGHSLKHIPFLPFSFYFSLWNIFLRGSSLDVEDAFDM